MVKFFWYTRVSFKIKIYIILIVKSSIGTFYYDLFLLLLKVETYLTFFVSNLLHGVQYKTQNGVLLSLSLT